MGFTQTLKADLSHKDGNSQEIVLRDNNEANEHLIHVITPETEHLLSFFSILPPPVSRNVWSDAMWQQQVVTQGAS